MAPVWPGLVRIDPVRWLVTGVCSQGGSCGGVLCHTGECVYRKFWYLSEIVEKIYVTFFIQDFYFYFPSLKWKYEEMNSWPWMEPCPEQSRPGCQKRLYQTVSALNPWSCLKLGLIICSHGGRHFLRTFYQFLLLWENFLARVLVQSIHAFYNNN